MEEVLDLYHRQEDPDYPLVCFDESCKQLVSEKREALAAKPGQPERYDYQYEREGVCNLFMFFAPLLAWRHVEVTDRRTQNRPTEQACHYGTNRTSIYDSVIDL